MQSAIYQGAVVHSRLRPKQHRLRYRVFSLLLDLDELPTLDRSVRWFGHNRRALVAFHDRDHGPADGTPLRPWVGARLRDAGIDWDDGPVRLLCYPRILGYVFNPLSVYFCYRRDGTLAATLHEVRNTFGERHTYVIPVRTNGRTGTVRQRCDKRFYVSPFIGMDAGYTFSIRPPGDEVSLAIRVGDSDGPILAAAFRGRHRPLTSAMLARTLARHPLMTFKVFAGIHWEALRLWLKGIRPLPHRPAEAPNASSNWPAVRAEPRA